MRSRIVLRRRHRWRIGMWMQGLHSDLESLSAVMAGSPVPVYLVGGLGLAVRRDRFYRNHGDIDVAVFDSDVFKLLSFLADRGFEMSTAVLGLAVSPWHRLDVVRPLSVGERPEDASGLRLLRPGGNVNHRRVDFMGVLPLGGRADGVYLHGYDQLVPWADFLPARPLAAGSSVLLPSLAYKKHLPAGWRRQRRDLQAAGLVA